MNEYDQKLADALLDSLMLNWEVNGNMNADAVRDACTRALAEVLDVSFEEIEAMVEARINNKQ
jgi:hypothetical protein